MDVSKEERRNEIGNGGERKRNDELTWLQSRDLGDREFSKRKSQGAGDFEQKSREAV